jgi:hypothetical protein
MAAPTPTPSSDTIRRSAPSFLQAFPDESGDDLALWLGKSDREFETMGALHMAARSRRLRLHAAARGRRRSAHCRHRQ